MSRAAWVGAVLAVAGAGPAAAATYGNARFGYAVSYPEDLLTPQREAANGDGLTLKSRSGRASFAVFAAYTLEDETPAAIARSAEEACHGTPPALRVAKRRLVALSCIHDGLIYYAKVLLGHGTKTELIAAYPVAERATWDRVVSTMAATLRGATR